MKEIGVYLSTFLTEQRIELEESLDLEPNFFLVALLDIKTH